MFSPEDLRQFSKVLSLESTLEFSCFAFKNIEETKKQNSGLNGIRTHDRYDTGAVLLPTELSKANWELVTLRVRNIPVDGEDMK